MTSTSAHRQALQSAWLLGISACICLAALVLLARGYSQRIAMAETLVLQERLQAMVPESWHDNDLLGDHLHWPGNDHEPAREIWRARQQEQPTAAVITARAPLGYNGPVDLLVAVDLDGNILAVRILAHRETPGLGDQIMLTQSDWILQFDGRSLQTEAAEMWRLEKDGGRFQHITGATITPRAVVGAVHETLLFYQNHREQLYQ